MTKTDIIEWCKANNQVEWLKAFRKANTTADKKPTFFSLKKAFAEKFMPEIIPQKKKKSMWDDIDNL